MPLDRADRRHARPNAPLGGRRPEAITADRGLAIHKVYWLLERRNIDPIIPWRIPNPQWIPTMEHERTAEWDEDGPRCKHCGGPSTMIGPRLGRAIVNLEPVVKFRCLLGHTKRCGELQSIPCRKCPRILTGVSKESERYQPLMGLHDNMERIFNEDRARFGVAGKDNTLRLRVVASKRSGYALLSPATSSGCSSVSGTAGSARMRTATFARRHRAAPGIA